jgi:5,10-methylenetetrahydromethanopterin reductase
MKRPIEFATTGFCPAGHGADVARTSEALGFDVQMYGENHAMAPDVFGEIRDAARATSTIRLLCGPVNFVTRDPGVIASSIAPLQLVANGRAICGIARGDSAVAMAGRKPQKQAALERDLTMLRTYLDHGAVEHAERVSRLEWIGNLPYQRVPIEMVCSGPAAIALGARVADRIGLSVGYHPERVRWALDIIDAELARIGRDRDDIRVGLFGPLAITQDRSEGPAVLKTRSAAWAHMSSFPGNDLSKQPPAMRKVTEALRHGYDYRFHRQDAPLENTNAALVDEAFADWFGVGGPPSYVLERFGTLVGLGIDFFSVVIPEPEREVLAAEVMPALRTLRS